MKAIVNFFKSCLSYIIIVFLYITYLPFGMIRGALDSERFNDYVDTLSDGVSTIIVRIFNIRRVKGDVCGKVKQYLKLYFFNKIRCIINEIIIDQDENITITFKYEDDTPEDEQRQLEVPLSALSTTLSMKKYINIDRQKRRYGGYQKYYV